MKQMKNIIIILLVVLIVICSLFTPETFITKNLSGSAKMSETSIMNPSNRNIVNKFNIM